MIRVSVIIPVYNAEKYLGQCLDSVLTQGLNDIEVICVDDGSSDKSRDILLSYMVREPRVKVLFNEKNMRAGACRNIGLKQAEGEYVLFLDADDWINAGSLLKLYAAAEKHKADIVRCRAFDYNNETGDKSESLHNALKRVPFFMFDRALSFKRLYWLLPKVNVAPWGGIFRRGFLEENGIGFNDLICVNDRSFFWETALRAERIVFSKEYMVFYRTNMSTSLIGNRIRNFDCHFKSYNMVSAMVKASPRKIRRSVLNAELLDIANWLERAAETEQFNKIADMLSSFLTELDKSSWASIENEKWFKRISRAMAAAGHDMHRG